MFYFNRKNPCHINVSSTTLKDSKSGLKLQQAFKADASY